ncbi:ABC transporter ATP-binding protein [Klebsiella pneumoniae]
MSSYRLERCGAGASYATAGETCRAGDRTGCPCRRLGQTLIVDDINLTIPTGKMTVLAGANGSGKSTLLSTIARMLKPLGGCVRLEQAATAGCDEDRLAAAGHPAQSPLTPEGLTVFELVSRGRYPWQGLMRQWSEADELAVEEALRLTGTAEFAIPVDSLSGGQRQRCWIAMALAQQTATILLDEPTTWLDLRYQVNMLELLQPSPANMAARW